MQLYTDFVCTFADNINQLRLVQICSRAVQQQCPNGTAAEYAAIQHLYTDLCDSEKLVEEANRVREVQRKKREKEREDAAKPAMVRKKEAKKKKEAEEKAKARASKATSPTAAGSASGGGGGDAKDSDAEQKEPEEDPQVVVEKQKADKLGPEASFVLQMEIAIVLLHQNLQDRAKVLITDGEGKLSSLDCADPFVHASLYRAKAQYHKLVGPTEEFFRNALRMSAYTPPDALSQQEQVAFAQELSLSAITGEGIYNFGEVVALPVFESLAGREDCAWLMKLMLAFKSGNMAEFNEVTTTYKSDIEQKPILRNNTAVLKVRVKHCNALQ